MTEEADLSYLTILILEGSTPERVAIAMAQARDRMPSEARNEWDEKTLVHALTVTRAELDAIVVEAVMSHEWLHGAAAPDDTPVLVLIGPSMGLTDRIDALIDEQDEVERRAAQERADTPRAEA